jgi:hypothetical protein
MLCIGHVAAAHRPHTVKLGGFLFAAPVVRIRLAICPLD